MHEIGIIHQDIKPENFRVHNGEVKVIDFGLSMEYKPKGKHKMHSKSSFQGTPVFASINAL
jgi:serine/threonine protein kinase